MASINSVVTTSSPWKTALQKAASRGDETKVQELLREAKELLPDGFEDGCRTVLQNAAGQGHFNIVRLLLSTSPKLDAIGTEAPALLRAVEWNHFPIVRILLENGASTEARDRFKRTAIFAAAAKQHVEALEFLLKFGADVNARDCDERNVLIYIAAQDVTTRPPTRTSMEESVQKLLLTPINLDVKDKNHRTALHWAAASGKADMVRLLASDDRGRLRTRLDVTNNRGRTPLHLATNNHHVEIVKILLDGGADPRLANDGGWTALHIAAERGYEDIVDLLLGRGVDINAETKLGKTPLHWAACNGHLGVTKLLLRNPDIRRGKKDAAGNTPLVQAAQNHHPAIVQLLSSPTDGSHLSVFAARACKEYKAAVIDFYPERTDKGRFTAVKRPSVFDLLYGRDVAGKPLISTVVENQGAKSKKNQQFPFRWIHLPANNVAWAEALIIKYFIERGGEGVEGFKAVANSLNQQRRGTTVFSHFMKPFCQLTGSNAPAHVSEDHPAPQDRSMDHANLANGTGEPYQAISNKIPIRSPRRPRPTPTVDANSGQIREDRAEEPPPRKHQENVELPKRDGIIAFFMPYLHFEFDENRHRMREFIDSALRKQFMQVPPKQPTLKEEFLIDAYLFHTPPLHLRHTLDQYNYYAIDTGARDQDQVVWRYCKSHIRPRKLFMVDQLWLWILSNDLIVTCFPQRWNPGKDNSFAVLEGIIDDIHRSSRWPPASSVHELASVITKRCSGLFYEDHHDEDYQFLDMFESSISDLVNKEPKLTSKFNHASMSATKWLKTLSTRSREKIPEFADELMDIHDEMELLAEAKGVRNELHMLASVLKTQQSIIPKLHSAILQEHTRPGSRKRKLHVTFKDQIGSIQTHLLNIQRMDQGTAELLDSVNPLLDLKQKYASVFEARFARQQATAATRQGQTIMVFTIVTIIFLPMSFMAAFFAINVTEFPRASDGSQQMQLSFVSKYTFGIGLAVSLTLIIAAFAMHRVIDIFSSIFSLLLSPARILLHPHISKSRRHPTEVLGQYGDSNDPLARREAIPIIEARSNVFISPLRLRAEPSWNLDATDENRGPWGDGRPGKSHWDKVYSQDPLEIMRSRRRGGRDIV